MAHIVYKCIQAIYTCLSTNMYRRWLCQLSWDSKDIKVLKHFLLIIISIILGVVLCLMWNRAKLCCLCVCIIYMMYPWPDYEPVASLCTLVVCVYSTYPGVGTGTGECRGDSPFDFRFWWGDSEGEGRGSTDPVGGG